MLTDVYTIVLAIFVWHAQIANHIVTGDRAHEPSPLTHLHSGYVRIMGKQPRCSSRAAFCNALIRTCAPTLCFGITVGITVVWCGAFVITVGITVVWSGGLWITVVVNRIINNIIFIYPRHGYP